MWYDDPQVREALAAIKLQETERGTFSTPDGLKGVIDFPGGIIITTRLWLDRPEFDIRTVHTGTGSIEFLTRSFREHIDEIRRKTKELQDSGLVAFLDRNRRSTPSG